MDWTPILGPAAGAAAGVILGALTTFIAPIHHRLARLGRRVFRDHGVLIAVETDLDAIFAGMPDWVTVRAFRPGPAPVEGPPGSRGEWQRWIAAGGGHDCGTTVIAITIVAEGETSVIMRPPAAVVHSHEPTGPGFVLARYVAGASINPLGFDIELDGHPEIAVLSDDGGKMTAPLSWALHKGDAQTVLLRVHCTTAGRWTWSARVPFLIDGRPVTKTIDDGGSPFVLVGLDRALPELTWDGQRWKQEGASAP